MEQRPLRLGDVVDDYCPRERRVTNHAIVALVEDVIKQTRCTTCDAEHPYKGGREPRLRKRPGTAALYDQVLADVSAVPPAVPPEQSATVSAASAPPAATPASESRGDEAADAAVEDRPDDRADAWLAHRQLIRATLPRTDSEPPARPIPEFTMHQRPTRGGRGFRPFNPNGNSGGNVNGNGPGRPRHGRGGRRRNKRPR
jgi:hypothetical protein